MENALRRRHVDALLSFAQERFRLGSIPGFSGLDDVLLRVFSSERNDLLRAYRVTFWRLRFF